MTDPVSLLLAFAFAAAAAVLLPIGFALRRRSHRYAGDP